MVQRQSDPTWKDNPDMARDFIERTDQVEVLRTEVFQTLAALAPFATDAHLRVLDVGSGHGVLAAAILDAFPNATALGLDVSEDMMAVGRERMAKYGDRFRYFVGDISVGHLPTDLPAPFDLVVSSLAIHHVAPEAKASFFADIHRHLADGGCFINLDNMRQRDNFLQENYDRVRAKLGDARGPRPLRRPRDPNAPQPPPRPEGMGGREYPDPMEDQLDWLRKGGFAHVDCLWKRLDYAMVGGFK